MNKKEVLELKRRFKKESATFTRVCGCYVDGNRNKICKIGNTFLNLEEEGVRRNWKLQINRFPVRLAIICWSFPFPWKKRKWAADSRF